MWCEKIWKTALWRNFYKTLISGPRVLSRQNVVFVRRAVTQAPPRPQKAWVEWRVPLRNKRSAASSCNICVCMCVCRHVAVWTNATTAKGDELASPQPVCTTFFRRRKKLFHKTFIPNNELSTSTMQLFIYVCMYANTHTHTHECRSYKQKPGK